MPQSLWAHAREHALTTISWHMFTLHKAFHTSTEDTAIDTGSRGTRSVITVLPWHPAGFGGGAAAGGIRKYYCSTGRMLTTLQNACRSACLRMNGCPSHFTCFLGETLTWYSTVAKTELQSRHLISDTKSPSEQSFMTAIS